MVITVEISYYPLASDYDQPVIEFIEKIRKTDAIEVQTGTMSTLLSGEYDRIMQILTKTIKPLMEKYPSVFILKMANACQRP